MILVTGGTGFLGHHIIPLLCREKQRVRVITRTPEQHTWLAYYPNVEVFEGDLRDAEVVQRAMIGCDQVIHAAGLFSMWRDAGDFEGTNVIGTRNVLEAAFNAQVKRLVFISTIAVIGKPVPDLIIDEEHPTSPADPYQWSKLNAEMLVQEYVERGLSAVILRPGAFYGPGGTYAFNRLFFRDPMRGLIMQMDGGRYEIFPAFIADVAQACWLALSKGASGEIYNICDDPITHRAAFDIICAEGQIHFPRLNIPGFIGINFARFLTALSKITRREPFYPVGLRSYVFNHWRVTSAKARRELGFQPTPFAEGARQTIDWYRAGLPDRIPGQDC